MPTIKAIRTHFPKAKISIIVKKHIAPLFEIRDLVNEVLYAPTSKGLRGLREELTLRKSIKAGKYDIAILFPNSLISALRVWSCGIPERIGYAREGRSILLTKTVKRTPQILERHTSEYYLNILSLFDISISDISLSIRLPEQYLNFANDYLKLNKIANNSVLIALGIGSANGKAKMWGSANYSELANELIEKYSANIVLICSPSEYEYAQSIAKNIIKSVLIPQTNLIESASILSKCSAFVGNDSGAMHLSALVGIPTIGLYFSTDPKCNYPLGKNSHYLTKKINCAYCGKGECKFKSYLCTKSITPDEVISKLIALGIFK
jgi:heptosyltransferase-2